MFKRFIVVVSLLALALPANAAPFGWVTNIYDLTATSYTYCTSAFPTSSSDAVTPVCGATNNDGWVTIARSNDSFVGAVEWVTKAATSLEYSLECRSYTSGIPIIIEQGSLSATGAKSITLVGLAYDQCRMGLKLTTDTGTNAVTAYFATIR